MIVQYERDETDVDSAEDLDALLDRLTAAAIENDRPLIVELVADQTAAMDIALGRSYSWLTYYDSPADPDVPDITVSAATLPTPEDDGFYYGGTLTPVRPGTAIAVDDARKAAREFLDTRRRPTCVDWRTP